MKRLLPFLSVISFVILFNSCFRNEPEIPNSSVHFPNLIPTIYKPWNIQRLLREENFAELNSIMEKLQLKFEENFINEFEMFNVFDYLYLQDKSYQENFENWVTAFPDTWQSRLARANYYYAMGWKSRGHKFSNETSPEQFRLMEIYFDKALTDVVRALQLNKKLIYAYSIFIGIQKNYSNDRYNIDAINKALEICPESYKIREIFMTDLFPRWGGSHKQMFAFANDAEKFAGENPLLKILKGYIFYDKGRYASEAEDYNLAEEYYSKALKFGECWNFYYLRARVYFYYLEKPQLALADINRCIKIAPYKVDALTLRAKINFELNKEKEATSDIELVQQINRKDDILVSLKKWVSQHYVQKGYDLRENDPKTAIRYYNRAEEMDPQNDELYYWRGNAFAKQNDFSRSLADMKTALRLNPKNYDAVVYIDWLLARQGKWNEIIPYWDSYISLVPDNPKAYMERGGTYYHMGNYKDSYRNAKKACDLGLEEACKMAEKFKQYK